MISIFRSCDIIIKYFYYPQVYIIYGGIKSSLNHKIASFFSISIAFLLKQCYIFFMAVGIDHELIF